MNQRKLQDRAILLLAVQTLFAKRKMALVHAPVCLTILEIPTTIVNRNVLRIPIAIGRKLVSIRNVEILAQEFADITQNAMSLITHQAVCV